MVTDKDIFRILGFSWNHFSKPEGTRDKPRSLMRAKKVLSGLVFDMAALEGNSFTYPEVQTLLDGITVGGKKLSEEQQVLNAAKAWQKLFKLVEADQFSLDKGTLCELHTLVAEGEALFCGRFRDGNVGIGGTDYSPPAPERLEEQFDRGLTAILQVEDVHLRAFVFFLFGASSQFFWDGNKRSSRLMMAGELLKHGYDIVNVPAKKQVAFNEKMIRFYNSMDATEMLEFLGSCSM
jgi:Fic family protein